MPNPAPYDRDQWQKKMKRILDGLPGVAARVGMS